MERGGTSTQGSLDFAHPALQPAANTKRPLYTMTTMRPVMNNITVILPQM